MKLRNKTILEDLPRVLARFQGKDLEAKCAVYEPPLRSELFSSDQMVQHGKTLAGSHTLFPGHAPDRLLARLAENEAILTGTRGLLVEAVKTDSRITPAAEWLLDNFYLIEEQIRTARRHLPKGYSRELPRLLGGPSAGLPRVYDIALETISHGDGRVDPESLSSFLAAYQTVTVLKLGELWAIPIMLRLALIENLRRIGARIAADRIDRDLAVHWADRITEVAAKDPKSLILVIADMARSNPPLKSAFVAEFARRLQGQGPALAMPLTWIEQHLSECSMTIDQLVQSENQQQAADQVSMSNSIGSLRFLGVMDWREFVETMSVVEQTLRADPRGTYGKMDFSTRDQYRHVVEKIARSGRLAEVEVAGNAIGLARECAAHEDDSQSKDNRMAHVGYYLIGKGLARLERLAGVRTSVTESLRKASGRFPLFLYLGAIILITAIFFNGLLAKARGSGLEPWLLLVTGILSLLCASQLAIAVVNWLATLLVAPHSLPRMDFSKGIPPESRTLAIVPTMLTSTQGIEDLIEALEVRFLANRDNNLHFGLLTDFQDASEEMLPSDEPMLRLAQQRIEELNEKYGDANSDRFFLFHRPRRWNPSERVWMGYERKRGKLAELNALLRGSASSSSLPSPTRGEVSNIPPPLMGEDKGEGDVNGSTNDRVNSDPGNSFSLIVGNTKILSNVKYVITLDTDTQLPRDSARQLVGAMAHPLNRALYDESKERVVAGYGILQPRVAVSLPGTNRSRYARMEGSNPGIDPYTRAVSDVYQDLFHEGSFIGKGIYEVDAFERALRGRFPENRILSHDLIEGCFARSGLLSDVMVYEEYPSRYSADVSRRHRWIRGDWQLLSWLRPNITGPKPGLAKQRQKNPLSLLSQWKLFDNLRRSLVPSALTVLVVLGWTVLSSPWFWTASMLGIILIPSLISSLHDLLRKPEDVLLGQHLAATGHAIVRRFAQDVFTLACLPYEAFFSLDAIVRTNWRMLVTHKRLLEWSQSSDPDRKSQADLASAYRTMWFAPVLSALIVTYLALSNPGALGAAGPLLALWFVSPLIAWWISRPLALQAARLSAGQTLFLRKLSRKTWAFFETFVGPEDHWLPPDNYQENPVPVVAHRTSPTNMGLALLANLSALDFGYIGVGQFIERTTNALTTMEALARYRGHFYNWYDTQSLKPLSPKYVSTVDSGNLAAHLLTLRQGLLALPDQKIVPARLFDGLCDTLQVLEDELETEESFPLTQPSPQRGEDTQKPSQSPGHSTELAEILAQLKKELESSYTIPPSTLAAARLCLDNLAMSAEELLSRIDNSNILLENQAAWWARAFGAQCRAAQNELTFLVPMSDLSSDEIPTLRELAHRGNDRAAERIVALDRLVVQCGELSHMEYEFLFDKASHLLSIGYNVDSRRRDTGYYDLLA